MVPIFQTVPTGAPGYGADEFERKLISICEKHREEGRALAFALIIYRNEDALLQKVLNDQHYWSALHSLSGHHLTVFAHHREFLPNFWEQPALDVEQRGKQVLDQHFANPPGPPGILFFQVANKAVVDHCFVRLKTDKSEEAFAELRDAIGTAVEHLRLVAPENRNNAREIFSQVKWQLQQRGLLVWISETIDRATKIKELVSLFY
jgi:hypothetical protein